MPHEIQFDAAGNLYIAERDNHVVRKIDAKTGVATTFAGTGRAGFSGDGGPAAQAELRQPHSIAVDRSGRLLICDIGNHRIRQVDLASGIITTYGGTGERQPTPDGAPVKDAPLNGPRTIAFDRDGDLYLALREGNAIYRIAARAGTIHHVAGTGEQGYAGDGGPARARPSSAGPKGLAWAGDTLFVADTENHVVRGIDLNTGIIKTVLGTGQRGDGPERTRYTAGFRAPMASSPTLAFSTWRTARRTAFGSLADAGISRRRPAHRMLRSGLPACVRRYA